MTDQPAPDVTTRPNVARMYDYYLGWHATTSPADRDAAEQVLDDLPGRPAWPRRPTGAFLRRAVRYPPSRACGSSSTSAPGMPTRATCTRSRRPWPRRPGGLRRQRPGRRRARQALLAGDRAHRRGPGRPARPGRAAGPPGRARGCSTSTSRSAVLLVAVLHFVAGRGRPVGGDRPAARRHRARQPPGAVPPDAGRRLAGAGASAARRVYQQSSAPLVPRTRAEIGRFFDGYDLVEPGLVPPAGGGRTASRRPWTPHGYAGVGVRR